jgi:hypothetical protein
MFPWMNPTQRKIGLAVAHPSIVIIDADPGTIHTMLANRRSTPWP